MGNAHPCFPRCLAGVVTSTEISLSVVKQAYGTKLQKRGILDLAAPRWPLVLSTPGTTMTRSSQACPALPPGLANAFSTPERLPQPRPCPAATPQSLVAAPQESLPDPRLVLSSSGLLAAQHSSIALQPGCLFHYCPPPPHTHIKLYVSLLK